MRTSGLTRGLPIRLTVHFFHDKAKTWTGPHRSIDGQGDLVVNKVISSDGESDEIDSENSDIGSNYSSEGDDDGYARL